MLDTGSGIPDYALSRIFERFYSFAACKWAKKQRSGLAFVSEVARLLTAKSRCATCRKVACRPRFDFTVTSHTLQILPT
ncbi:hypothetical protein ACVXHA_29080 [Escherichia coli]